jgi:hypothetical protein
VSRPPLVASWRKAVLSEQGPSRSTTQHLLLALSVWMDLDGGNCFPSTALIARATRLSERSVCTHLERAEAEGWIRRRAARLPGKQWARMQYTPTIPEALNDVPYLEPQGTEGRSVPNGEGTEPLSMKALNVVQSTNTVTKPKTNTAAVASDVSDLFEDAWKAYPRRPNDSKAAARKAWTARVKAGADPTEMLDGTRRYAEYVAAEETEPRYVKQAATFFGPSEWWKADYTHTNGNGRPDRPHAIIED